jgi:hypothetical protein
MYLDASCLPAPPGSEPHFTHLHEGAMRVGDRVGTVRERDVKEVGLQWLATLYERQALG